jgi:polysaccharide pyruvyl transferase WcaK-like protein
VRVKDASAVVHRDRTPVVGRRRLGFFGVLGSGNLGNDGSLDAIVTYVRRRHPEAELHFIGMAPERLHERYGAPATHLQWYESHLESLRAVPAPLLKVVGRLLDPLRTMRWLRDVDVAIVPGMGILETTTPLRPWGFPYGLFWLCASARITGTRVLMVSVGGNVIRQRLTRWLMVSSARLAHYRSYRDQTTLEAMRTMGVDVSQDEIYPDVALALPVPPAASHRTGRVGLGLMDYWGDNDERDEAARLNASYLETMRRFATWLIDHGRTLQFFTCDPVDAQVIARFIDDLRRARPGLPPGAIAWEPAPTLQDLMTQMTAVDAVVATRYHNVVGAVRMNLPTISVGYGAKHDELMREMGLADFCQPARLVDLNRLVQQFGELELRRDELHRTMAEANEHLAAGVDRQFAALSDLLTAAAR